MTAIGRISWTALVLLPVLFAFFQQTSAHMVELAPSSKECFFEDLNPAGESKQPQDKLRGGLVADMAFCYSSQRWLFQKYLQSADLQTSSHSHIKSAAVVI